jgi:pSer/pThr/pTyr-binding forkhead associated (FHA) protein
VEVSKDQTQGLFQLVATNSSIKTISGALSVGRYLIGRSESCELVIVSNVVSSVHAVLEVTPQGIKVYDMNSRNGTYVNGSKIIAQAIVLGDTLSFGNIEFSLRKYQTTPDLPPVLETLDPIKGQASLLKNTPELPKSAVSEIEVPYIVYPLSLDSGADFSEYIFEDKDDLYPIFKYEVNKNAVEIIILFKDLVYSVDYLPQKNGTYHIKGLTNKANEVEFPYLGKDEKVNFVEIKDGNCKVNQLHSYDLLYLSDKEVKTSNEGSVHIGEHEIVKLSNGDLEIYIRRVSAPPKVKAAPFFRRDKDLRVYLLLVLLFILTPLISLQFLKVEKPEDVPDPERIATILYKQKLKVNVNKTVAKNKKKDKKKKQKIKKNKKVLKKQPNKNKASPLKNTKSTKVVKKDPGNKKAIKKQVVKKVDKPLKKRNKKVAKNTAKAATPNKRNKSRKLRYSNLNIKSVGKVDVYKSIRFKSNISNLMAKGGSLSGARTAKSSSSNSLSSASVSGGVENIKNASVNGKVGSLAGSNTGILGTTKGAGGLSAKTGVYTAGIPSETVVLGSMDPDVIRRILRDHIPQFRGCYQRELDRNSRKDVSGSIRLVFTIGASGAVRRAGVDGRTVLPSKVKKCVVSVLRGIQFPSPIVGGTVDVMQPFNFYPKRI